MMRDSVNAGKTRVLLAAALAFMAQGAWSEESNDAEPSAEAATAHETVTSVRPAEFDIPAYIEELNKRLSEKLAREIEALNAARVELAIAEVPTRG
jgi:hypothetical protein